MRDEVGARHRVGVEGELEQMLACVLEAGQLSGSAAVRSHIRVHERAQLAQMLGSGRHPHQYAVVGEYTHGIGIDRGEYRRRRIERGVHER